MANDIPFLTDLQLAVMRVLWGRGAATVAEITDELRPSRGLAQTTIATVLSRLEKRGIVGHDAQTRQFVYRALISEPDARGSMVAELTDRLFAGDSAALVSHLLTARQFSKSDLARVKAILAEHERSKGARR
ncbi:MAG: BlaI/MecI/CopY family transcriptional regulator [Gemmatimonadales bacterium]